MTRLKKILFKKKKRREKRKNKLNIAQKKIFEKLIRLESFFFLESICLFCY